LERAIERSDRTRSPMMIEAKPITDIENDC